MSLEQLPTALVTHVTTISQPTSWWPNIVSIVSALIALGALAVTAAKYRMDLYDRRFAIYTATLDLYLTIYTGSDEDLDKFAKPFIKGVRESQYLFDPRSGIYESLELFRIEFSKVKAFRDENAKPKINRDQSVLNILHRNQIESPIAFEKILKDIEYKLKPYLTYRILDFKIWRYWGRWKPRSPTKSSV